MFRIQKTYQNKIATLYLIATPIGNLEAISLNVIETLKKIPVIFCEDTRISQKIFDQHGIVKRKYSFHKFNEEKNSIKIINHLKNGKNVGLISCAGIPLIADPGFGLVKKIINLNFNVTSIGVNSAFLAALMCSGIPPEPFVFCGFLKATIQQKTKQLQEILKISKTVVFYESLHQIQKTLLLLKTMAPERDFALAREISKKHETFYRGKLKELKLLDITWKGEFTLVLASNKEKRKINPQEFLDKINKIQLDKKQILMLGKSIFGFQRKELYDIINTKNKRKK